MVALLTVRLERSGPAGEAAAVALAERFIESLDSEIRQMGVGDPALGRQVRALVGALASRVERWRSAVDGGDWSSAVLRSVYRDSPPPAGALEHAGSATQDLWARLEGTGDEDVAQGRIG